MRKVSIDGVPPEPADEYHSDRRPLSEPLNTSDVAITRYVLEPGERFSGSVHAHVDQEEVFVVLEGEATFETEDGEVVVGEDEAVRFGPGEFQTGANDGDEPVVALALGAPRETNDIRISRIPVLGDRDVACSDCGHDHMRVPTGAESGLVCPACGATLVVEEPT
ncbi:cupin domain-containing protein [Natronobeatus ordinarius]|uniref:cupin domain-containing protein n=1 Tax=Natronobeatus ordinarius TaxID=2963433 RepID=UPI0020CBAC86|nr:cupin domain-containing protein [Natronobeatus ordinarius]